MPYPQIKLTRPYRLAIMIFLIMSFFIASPLIILYTAGYRYDWQQNKIKQTGVISIDATPESSSVYLNNVEIDKKLPIRLSNRAPGTYHLKIKNAGHKTWEKDIEVKSKKTTYIKKIQLIKNELPIEVSDRLNIENIVDIYPSINGSQIILVQEKDNLYEVQLFDLSNRQVNTLARYSVNQGQPSISWSPQNQKGVITVNNNSSTKVQVFDTSNQQVSEVFNLNKELKKGDYQWRQVGAEDFLYIKRDNEIWRLGESDQVKVKAVSKDFDSWFIDENGNYWIFSKTDNQIYRNSFEGDHFNISENIELILDVNTNRIIAQTEDETYIYQIKDKKITDTNSIRGTSFTKTQTPERTIVWSPWQFWEVNNSGNLKLLNRTSEEIKDIKSLDNYGVLLVHTNEAVKSFNPNYYVTQTIFSNGKIKKIGVDTNNRSLYMWGKIGNKKGIFQLNY